MPHRYNHYDQAFAAYLRHHRRPCVAVDESRRALAASASLKSPDFVVSAGPGDQWLIDVKGRKFPTGAGAKGSGHLWENWVTRDDIESLLSWEAAFGGQFRGLLVFAYELLSDDMAELHEDVWIFRERRYAFYAVAAREYSRVMRPRSASWETVSLPAAQFRRLRAPLARMLSAETASDAIPASLATGSRDAAANRPTMMPADV